MCIIEHGAIIVSFIFLLLKLIIMKKTIFLILFCAGSTMLFAQQSRHRNPPTVVVHSYQKDYPNYNNQTWDQRNNEWHTRYADRDHGNRNVDVYYDTKGRRIRSQSEWDRNDLPVAVRDRIRTHYKVENYNAYRVERPNKGFFFQISLGGNKNVYLDERGREVRYR
jgi:hypothetical protein